MNAVIIRNFFAFALCVLVFSSVSGQFIPGTGEDQIIVSPNKAPDKAILKVSLIAPVEQLQCLRFSLEIPVSDKLSIEPETGYIFNYRQGVYRIIPGTLNFEQRLGLRYYIPGKVINGIYAGPLLSYTNYKSEQGAWKVLYPGAEDSIKLDFSDPWKYSESRLGAYIIAGIQPIFSRHFSVDLNGGIGLQMTKVSTTSDPELMPGSPLPPARTFFKVLGILSFRIGYIF